MRVVFSGGILVTLLVLLGVVFLVISPLLLFPLGADKSRRARSSEGSPTRQRTNTCAKNAPETGESVPAHLEESD